MQFTRSDNMKNVHSDIRGPLYLESQKMIKNGIDVLRLNTGNPGTFGFTMPDSIKKALLENADKAVPYCDLKGMPDAREALLNYHLSRGFTGITTDDIYIGNGVSELVTMALTALLNNGDEVLMPSPSYSLWSNSAYIAGGKPVFYNCDESNAWYPDIDDIKAKITNKTRALVIINPNNPTGAVYPKEIVCEMLEVARQNNLIVFSDEIYDRLVMDGLEYHSTAPLAPDLTTITFNGLSKSHCLCGFRCGWMVISRGENDVTDYVDGIFQLAAMRLCSNTLTQLVIPAAMQDTESTRQMIIPGGRLYEQREATMREIEKIDGLTCVKNSAAFYVFPKLDVKKFNITSDKKFAFDLLKAKNILIVPGSGFDVYTNDHFRIVMLPEPERMGKAIRDIGDFLKTYKQD